MKIIAKLIVIVSIMFNVFLFGIYFWALFDKIQNPGYKNLSYKDYVLIGIGLIFFAVINVVFARKIYRKSTII